MVIAIAALPPPKSTQSSYVILWQQDPELNPLTELRLAQNESTFPV